MDSMNLLDNGKVMMHPDLLALANEEYKQKFTGIIDAIYNKLELPAKTIQR